MLTLPLESVPEWIAREKLWLPTGVDCICPYCERQVTFSTPKWSLDTFSLMTASHSVRCPGCREKVRFWAVDPREYPGDGTKECGELCIHPTPKLQRKPMAHLDKVPEAVARAYVSAVNVFNSREWNGTAVLVGRALEGLIKSVMPPDKQNQPLGRMLDQLPNMIDLTKTLTTLTDGIRKGRNLGAHFDLEKEANAEVARMMIDFLEYFLEYLYILPGEVEELHSKL